MQPSIWLARPLMRDAVWETTVQAWQRRSVVIVVAALATVAIGLFFAIRASQGVHHAGAKPKGGVLARFSGIGVATWRCTSNAVVELAGRPMPYEVSYEAYVATEQVRVWSGGALSESAVLQPGDVLVVRPNGWSLKVRAVQATEPKTVVATTLVTITSGRGCEAPSVRSLVATPRPVVGG